MKKLKNVKPKQKLKEKYEAPKITSSLIEMECCVASGSTAKSEWESDSDKDGSMSW